MTKIPFIEGAILLVDKPLTWTSFDVVKKIRYEIIKRILSFLQYLLKEDKLVIDIQNFESHPRKPLEK